MNKLIRSLKVSQSNLMVFDQIRQEAAQITLSCTLQHFTDEMSDQLTDEADWSTCAALPDFISARKAVVETSTRLIPELLQSVQPSGLDKRTMDLLAVSCEIIGLMLIFSPKGVPQLDFLTDLPLLSSISGAIGHFLLGTRSTHPGGSKALSAGVYAIQQVSRLPEAEMVSTMDNELSKTNLIELVLCMLSKLLDHGLDLDNSDANYAVVMTAFHSCAALLEKGSMPAICRIGPFLRHMCRQLIQTEATLDVETTRDLQSIDKRCGELAAVQLSPQMQIRFAAFSPISDDSVMQAMIRRLRSTLRSLFVNLDEAEDAAEDEAPL